MDQQEAIAVERFALNVTIPILIETEHGGNLHATGTLFEIRDRFFIITAQHIFDNVPDLTKLAVPHNPFTSGLSTLGTFDVLKPTEPHIDVAVIELKSAETIAILRSGWKFLSLQNVGYPSRTALDESFFVSGYPIELANRVGGWVTGKFFTAYTQLIPNVPVEAEQPVIDGLDLFFDYAKEATLITGGLGQTPEAPGLSGASIWERRKTSGIWTPESATCVVGVQSAYVHSKYIRAKSWMSVAKVLEQADRHLAEAVKARLNEI
jgi:hypothetical protein